MSKGPADLAPGSLVTSKTNGSTSSKSIVPTVSAAGARGSLIPKMPSRLLGRLSSGDRLRRGEDQGRKRRIHAGIARR